MSAKDSAALGVTGTDTWAGSFKFFLCGPIATADTCDGSTGHVVSPTANGDLRPLLAGVVNRSHDVSDAATACDQASR